MQEILGNVNGWDLIAWVLAVILLAGEWPLARGAGKG